jgi:protein-disulfide isomerase
MRTALVALVCCAPAAAAEPAPAPRPAPARAATLGGGRFVWPGDAPGRAACVVFVAADCPIANASAPEVARIAAEYGKRGVSFLVAYPVTDLSAADAAKHAKDYAFGCPAALDRDLALARRLGATVTPEVVVMSAAGEVVYRGRIDDRYPKAGGKRRENPTTRDLRDALDAVLAGKPVVAPWPPAVGCDIWFGK